MDWELYLKKLIKYAESIEVSVYFSAEGLAPEKSESYYYYKRKKPCRYILVEHSSTEIKVYTLLHELGHAMDEALSTKKFFKRKKGQTKQKWIFNAEVRAWRNAKALAYMLKIKLADSYEDHRRECLATYL